MSRRRVLFKRCPDCVQPLSDHCEGCHEDVKAGVKIEEFCGEKGNTLGTKAAVTFKKFMKKHEKAFRRLA